ncbi:MAG: hypothetical protein JXA30_22765 [Deltaproteobacteria bacterium]|nr:hypothetical protein [Deltaproteobacteria bacterium]
MNPVMNTAQQNQEVHRQVAQMLSRSKAFSAFPEHEKAAIQQNTAAIIQTMAQNKLADAAGRTDPYAVPLTGDQVQSGMQNPLNTGGQTGQSNQPAFTGGATDRPDSQFGPTKIGEFGTGIATGVTQAGELLRQVNFTAFVAELIQGVFQAVVDASIQQMKAYGELVQSVAMSLSDFRDANVSENQARDHLVDKYPSLMQINITDGQPRVGLREDADLEDLPDFGQDFGLGESISDLDEETIENILVPAARNELARSRQSLLATMMLMGINRIVVTDGKINAKLKFDFKAKDTMQSRVRAYDYENMGTTKTQQRSYESSEETGEGYEESGSNYRYNNSNLRGGYHSRSGESSRWAKGEDQYVETPAIYLTEQSDTTTDAALEASAKLLGEVSLNFKSETVDLNNIASQSDIFKLQQARGAGRGAPPSPPAGAPPSATTEPSATETTTPPA